MSALVGLFYLCLFFGLPLGLMWWMGERWKTPLQRVIIIIVAMTTYGLLIWLLQHEKWEADDQVRELCAKDGGVKVYEQVVLPAERFDKWGTPVFFKGGMDVGPEYRMKSEKKYFRKSEPTLIRHHYLIYRQSDGLLLGETISYGRGGGDLPGPWHPSSFTCPDILASGPNALIKSVFVKSRSDVK